MHRARRFARGCRSGPRRRAWPTPSASPGTATTHPTHIEKRCGASTSAPSSRRGATSSRSVRRSPTATARSPPTARRRGVALRLIKTVARRNWPEPDDEHRYATWYEPIDDAAQIRAAVSWALAQPVACGLATPGDVGLLGAVIAAEADRQRVTDAEHVLAEVARPVLAVHQRTDLSHPGPVARLTSAEERREPVQQAVDVGLVGVRRQPDPQAAVVAQPEPAGRLDGVERPGRRVDPELGQELVRRLRRPARRRSAAGSACAAGALDCSRHARQRGQPALEPRAQVAPRAPRARPSRPAPAGRRGPPAASASSVGVEVDGRGHAGQQLVGQRAELEPLGHVVGRRQKLVRMQRFQQLRPSGRPRRSAARGTCTASRRRSPRRAPPRRPARAASGARRRRRAARPSRAPRPRSPAGRAGCRAGWTRRSPRPAGSTARALARRPSTVSFRCVPVELDPAHGRADAPRPPAPRAARSRRGRAG